MFDHTLDLCRSLPAVSTEKKWDNELRFFVGEKLFCMISLDPPHRVSFKCSPTQFHQLINRPEIVPAPHLARYHWVQLKGESLLPETELDAFLHNAYELIKSTLPPQEQDAINKMRMDA
ncbi:MmcQ/YjbR family DNA-binding protein [Chitinophaga nivalis]|uniref:MmcQ/YjbR family DNA-binding protein n=1 Tax=Chitinophaga nivalis TaxID=2991709 RepID=A0ABT3ITB8_9BACT|nr:MmcQ/YjbR family DNA-binding protein [Chitinophaga nivalis]MCW3463083.1 MmcQ/YjbR family DNA-binding protein [Chitinophaga nivalis]MCW3487227.1 MmcQ/YjbR family DNA-binding protein [Chitinophaga nivalis]